MNSFGDNITIVIKDEKDNVLINVKNGKCLLSRFKDIDEDLKNKIIDIFIDLTDSDREEIIKFLDFKDDVQKFCS